MTEPGKPGKYGDPLSMKAELSQQLFLVYPVKTCQKKKKRELFTGISHGYWH